MFVALDCETSRITDTDTAPPIACVQLAMPQGVRVFHVTEALRWVEGVLRDPTIHIVGSEIAFDMVCIMRQWPHLAPYVFQAYADDRVEDIGLNCNLRDIAIARPTFTYSLDKLSGRFLNAPMVHKGSEWRTRFGELIPYPLLMWPREAIEYAEDDAHVALAIFNIMREQSPDRFRQARAGLWLKLASVRGITTDPVRVDAFERQLRVEYNERVSLLMHHGLMYHDNDGYHRNIKAASARMFALNPNAERTTRGAKLSKDVLNLVQDPVLTAYSEIQALQKKLGEDIPLLRQGEIHTHFEVLKKTGRTGSKADEDDRGGNIQNRDRKSGSRECFVPRPGYDFACADYDRGELSTWGQVCLWLFGRSRMVETINAGGDAHLEVAKQIMGSRFDPKNCDDERQVGKVVNFGCPGGMGVDRLVNYAEKQYGVTLTFQQAKELRETWRNTWPEARQYHAWINSLMGGANTCTITQFVSNRVRGGCHYTDACNSFFQGLLADIAKDAGFNIARQQMCNPNAALYGCHIVNFGHDEFISEAPHDRAPYAAEEQSYWMVEAAQRWLPDVRQKAKPLLARRWSKKAEAIKNAKGLLIPWEQSSAA